MFNFIVWDVSPEVLSFSEVPRWYGLLWCAGIIISYYIMYYLYKRDKKPIDSLDTLTLYVIVGTLVGARLGHVLFYSPEYYWQHPLEIFFPFEIYPEFKFIGFEGLASHGGAIGILLAILIYSKRYGHAYFTIVDNIVIIGALTGGFIRLGNLMNSEMIGIPTDAPWAFVFLRYDHTPRHPAQLYEALFCFILFVVLFRMRLSADKLRPGLLTGIFLLTLFTERFLTEFLKINQEKFEDGLILNMGQILSIPMILAGAVILFLSLKTPASTLKQ